MDNYLIPANHSTENDLLIVELDDRIEFSVISPTNLCAQTAGNVTNNCSCGTQNGGCKE